MKKILPVVCVCTAVMLLTGCQDEQPSTSAPVKNAATSQTDKATGTPETAEMITVDAAPLPTSAANVKPLEAGAKAPATTLLTAEGKEVSLAGLYAQKPTILIFYRGSWCPYCNAHLAEVAKSQDKLAELGYQVIAVSPDGPEKLQGTIDKNKIEYQVLSDAPMQLAKDYGVAFVAAPEGNPRHLLPVPAVYIVGTDGVIKFAHWNPDYKDRIKTDALLVAAADAMK